MRMGMEPMNALLSTSIKITSSHNGLGNKVFIDYLVCSCTIGFFYVLVSTYFYTSRDTGDARRKV